MPTTSPWQRPPGPFDVAVVGGGAIGAATAWALGRLRPGLRVVLVEAESLAHGASGRNAGFLLPGTHRDPASAVATYGAERAGRLLDFTLENVALVEGLARAHPAFEYAAVGHRLAAGTAGEAERLRESVPLLESKNVGARFLDGAEAARRTAGEHFEGMLEVDVGGTMHPARLVRLLAALSGAHVLEGWPVEGLGSGPEGVRLNGPAGEAIDAGRVVLALNAFLPRLLPDLARYVRPVRGQMLATERVAPFLDRPVYSHEGYFYVRQTPDGRLLLGGARHLHLADEVGFEDATTDAVQSSLESYLARHFPLAAGAAVVGRWSGTMGFSPDSLPVVGEVPGVAGASFACGFTGHGMGYALRFGELLARRTLGEADDAADLFDAARLGGVPPAASDGIARPDLQSLILALIDADERTRARLAADGSLFAGYHAEMEAVHRANAEGLRRVIADVGWPGRSLVGERAAGEAWRIAEHAIAEPDFQRAALRMVEVAVARGEAPPWQAAFLEDRIRSLEGRAQRYGTQYDWDERGEMSPHPDVDDPSAVDARRATVGLDPLAENTMRMRAGVAGSSERPPADLEERRREMDAWARRVGWRV